MTGKSLNEDGEQVHPGEGRNTESSPFLDTCLDCVVFPSLLFIQFGATMFCQSKEGVLALDWRLVFSAICLFCIVAAVYRQIMRRHQWGSLLLLLLPEIFTNLLLAMVMLVTLLVAYQALLGLTAILSLVGSCALIHISIDGEGGGSSRDYQLLDDDTTAEEDDEFCDVC